MEIASVIKKVVFPALLISLTACSESDEVYEEPNTGNAIVSASGTNETEPDDSGLGASDEPDANALVLPTPGVPQFVTSACGSLPTSTAVQSNIRSAPTAMITGQLVSGIIKSGPATNIEHYWSIALEPGDYHVVLDSKHVDGGRSSLGIRLSELHTNGGVTDRLNGSGEFDYRNRTHGFFTVEVARTVLLRLTPNYEAEDYTLGIFANGSAVPSPFFSDCPTIKSLSVDTVEALLLPEEGSSTGDRWYLADLEEGVYEWSSQATHNDGSSGRMQYNVTQVDQFGQIGRTVEFGSLDETGSVTNTNSAELKRDNAGPVWIRIQNLFTELTMEFSLNSGL